MKWECSSLPQKIIDEKVIEWEEDSLLTTLLLNREFKDKHTIEKFLNSNVSYLRNPFDFENMKKIVSKILDAREKKHKVFVYGDYDVDGITATVFLVKILTEIGINTEYYIPNRMEDGYGLDKKALSYMNENECKLVITVDTGVNSEEDVEYANFLGIDIIITDHHKSLKTEEDINVLMLNPKLSDTYEFKHLSGAGVALKVAQALYLELKIDLKEVYKYLDIVMIGTVADVVPMFDENRIIIKEGLRALKNTKIKGLMYLLKYLKLQNKELTTTDVSYFISPLINSLGRIGISRMGAEFFLQDDEFEIYNIIEEMKKANKKRRELEGSIYDEADFEISKIKNVKPKSIFLYSDKWHPGVIGVVASRLTIKYRTPVVLVAIRGDIGKASCRSVDGISVFNLIERLKDKIIRFGGHDLAAGFVINIKNIKEVKEKFISGVESVEIRREEKNLKIDMEYPIEKIDERFFETLDRLAPFGLENPYPLFLDKNVSFHYVKKFGINSRHFGGIINKKHRLYQMVGFDLGNKIDELEAKIQKFDIVYYPEKVFYKDQEVIQIRIKDIKIKDEFFEIFK